MAQKLILPFDNCQLNAGYKAPRYLKEWGFNHYGVDLIERVRQREVYAIGSGRVVACGMDGQNEGQRLGNCIVVVYDNVLLPGGRVLGLACRMYHLAQIHCAVGDRVEAGTVLGEYGSTGRYTSGPHLHIEFDTDVRYPTYAYGLSQNGNVIQQGSVDSTLDPCKIFWLGAGQSITAPTAWITEGWINPGSLTLPLAGTVPPPAPPPDADLAKLRAENAAMKALLQKINSLTA